MDISIYRLTYIFRHNIGSYFVCFGLIHKRVICLFPEWISVLNEKFNKKSYVLYLNKSVFLNEKVLFIFWENTKADKQVTQTVWLHIHIWFASYAQRYYIEDMIYYCAGRTWFYSIVIIKNVKHLAPYKWLLLPVIHWRVFLFSPCKLAAIFQRFWPEVPFTSMDEWKQNSFQYNRG